MIKKQPLLVFWILLLLMALACEAGGSSTNYNGKTGSASESNATCQSSNQSGGCSGELNNLSGTWFKRIENKNFRPSNKTVKVTATVAVGSGAVKVYVLDAKGQPTAVDIQAGNSGKVEGLASITANQFNVFFEVADGKAEKVIYNIQYTPAD